MRLLDNKPTPVSAYEYKHVIEIMLDRLGLYSASKHIHDSDLAPMGLKANSSFMEVLSKVAEKENLSELDKRRILQNASDYLSSGNKGRYFKDYCFTKEGRTIIDRELRNLGLTKFTSVDSLSILNDFAVYFEDTAQYAYIPAEGSRLLAFITRGMRDFISRRKADVASIINIKGQSVDIGDETVALANLESVKVNVTGDIDFRKEVNKILVASKNLYSGNNAMIYDLFSRYKNKKLTEKTEKIASVVRRSLGPHVAGLIALHDCNSDSLIDYREKTIKKREEVFNILDRYEGVCVPPKTLRAIHDNLKALDDELRRDGNSANLFSSRKSPYSFTFELVCGFNALNSFIGYLSRINVEPLSIPSAIFRDDIYSKRFNSLDEYMDSFVATRELVSQGKQLTSTCMLPTNDEFYDGRIPNDRYDRNPKLHKIESYTFAPITELLSGKKKEYPMEPGRFSDSEYSLKYKIMAYIKEGSVLNFTRSLLINTYKELVGATGKLITPNAQGTRFYNGINVQEIEGKKVLMVDKGNMAVPTQVDKIVVKPICDKLVENSSLKGIGFTDKLVETFPELLDSSQRLITMLRFTSFSIAVIDYYVKALLSKNFNCKSFLDIVDLVEGGDYQILTQITSNEDINTIIKYSPNQQFFYYDDVEEVEELEMFYAVVFEFIRENILSDIPKLLQEQVDDVYDQFDDNNIASATTAIIPKVVKHMLPIMYCVHPSRERMVQSILVYSNKDRDGFILKGINPITEVFNGHVYYLHSFGYWVGKNKTILEYTGM